MSKIAIDIVLLPDNKTQDLCWEVNKNIWGKIDFTNTWKTPHISLLMWLVDEWDLERVQERLTNVSQEYSKIQLTWRLRKYVISNTDETWYSYELDHNEQVKIIFEELIARIRPLLGYEDISSENFFEPEQVEEQSFPWVEWFKNRTIEEYSSHITLWIWELKWENPSVVNFSTDTLAIYQLWNYCTCENELFEINF